LLITKRYSKATITVTEFKIYGPMHPTLGIHLMKFAKILLHIEKPNEAEEYFRVRINFETFFGVAISDRQNRVNRGIFG